MANSSVPTPPTPDPQTVEATPLRCLVGSGISGTLTFGLYRLTAAIALSFATKPVISDNQMVHRISSAVRTLVLGVASLATFIFGFVAIGLILLAIQLTFQSLTKKISD